MSDPEVEPSVSLRMARTKGRDTLPERRLRSELHRRGLRFRKNFGPKELRRRTADIAFTKARVLVFVDGCFWHRCPDHYVVPKTRTEFWVQKIGGNVSRDMETDRLLAEHGWTVIRIWEHEPLIEAADKVERALRRPLA